MPVRHPDLGLLTGAIYNGKRCVKIVFEGKTIWTLEGAIDGEDPGVSPHVFDPGLDYSTLIHIGNDVTLLRPTAKGSTTVDGPFDAMGDTTESSSLVTLGSGTIYLEDEHSRGSVTGPGPFVVLDQATVPNNLIHLT